MSANWCQVSIHHTVHLPVTLETDVGVMNSSAAQTTTENVMSTVASVDVVLPQTLHKYADRFL